MNGLKTNGLVAMVIVKGDMNFVIVDDGFRHYEYFEGAASERQASLALDKLHLVKWNEWHATELYPDELFPEAFDGSGRARVMAIKIIA